MAEYRREACFDCEIVLPANELHRINEKVTTGGSNWSSTRRDPNWNTLSTSSGSSSSYKYRTIYLCDPCQRARFRALLLQVIILLVVVLGVVVFLATRPATKPDAPTDSLQDAVAPEYDDPSPTNLLPEAISDEPDASTDDAVANIVERDFVEDIAPENSPVLPEPTVEQAITTATLATVGSGQPRMWDSSERSGWIVPSAELDDRGQKCRNVLVTEIRGQQQSEVSTSIWCKRPDGKWAAGRP